MKSVTAVVLVASAAKAVAVKVTPVQKVVQLMEGMLAKGKKEKHEEEVQFAAYKTFCEGTAVDKDRSIKQADETIVRLKADIEKAIADASKLGKEIAAHDEDISVWKGDVKAATSVRKIEKTDYTTLHKDLSESVSAITRAIAVLKAQTHDKKQASLVQVKALSGLELIPKDAKKAIDAFVQSVEDPAGLAVSAPQANGYENQSGGVIEMLEKLQDKFSQERTVAEKEEMESKNAFEMMMQDLNAQIDEAERDRSSKSESKSRKLQARADGEGDLTDTTTTRADDSKYLTELTATCEQKANDFESRQDLRAEEIEAVEKAVDIISSGAVSGAADKHLPSLSQMRKGALAQLRSGESGDEAKNRGRAVAYLQDASRRLNSRVLSALASKVTSDPFGKIKKMIKDLIMRLMEEANEETSHKGWCDTELSTNGQTRKEKTESVELLTAEIDQLESSLAKLGEDIADLTKAVAELDAAMAKATQIRQEEKATNTATIKDAQGAQTAVAQALVVLKEFYAKAAEATALVQQQPEAPEIFDKPYQGMGAESGGVVGMLEVIEADFARLETSTSTAEDEAQSEYDSLMTDSKVDKAAKSSSIKHKSAKEQDQSQALTTKKSDIEGTQKELDAALAYYDKLKPTCVDSGVSYEDRVSRRKEEIESLQTALRILNGEDLA